MKTSAVLNEFSGILGVTGVALVILAQPVISAGTGDPLSASRATTPQPNAAFASIDVNADGHISRREAQQDLALSLRFQSVDRDNDGFLSAQEHARYRAGSLITRKL